MKEVIKKTKIVQSKLNEKKKKKDKMKNRAEEIQ